MSTYVPFVPVSRRWFLRNTACGFGALALNAMLAESSRHAAQAAAGTNPLAPRPPHYHARAKRVIFLFMAGGPSQHDLFDHKPRLVKDHGRPPGVRPSDKLVSFGLDKSLTLGPCAKFAPRGKSGIVISDLLPKLAEVADELCVLKGMQVDNLAHDLATLQFHTGAFNDVRPSMGAWMGYGLGTENQNMPSYVSIHAGSDVRTYGAGFLPAVYQGTVIGSIPTDPKQPAIKYLQDPQTPGDVRRRQVDLVQAMNRRLGERLGQDAAMEGVIESFELAFRMQAETPKLVDLSRETRETLDLYGVGKEPTDRNGRACLLARRLSEAGVRFVQVTMGGWDHHMNLRDDLPKTCQQMDQPAAALVADLKRRGLLDDTLVLWSGEFGRTPWSQDLSGTSPLEKHGREHQPESFTAWLAGGGVKRGFSHGETDEYGWQVVAGRVHLHDLHATILHILGLNHERLTYRNAGRDYRLTDVFGRVVKEILD
jgi:hypothetical protein